MFVFRPTSATCKLIYKMLDIIKTEYTVKTQAQTECRVNILILVFVTTVAVSTYIWCPIFLPNFPKGMLMDPMLKKVEKFRDFIVNQHICDLIEVK